MLTNWCPRAERVYSDNQTVAEKSETGCDRLLRGRGQRVSLRMSCNPQDDLFNRLAIAAFRQLKALCDSQQCQAGFGQRACG